MSIPVVYDGGVVKLIEFEHAVPRNLLWLASNRLMCSALSDIPTAVVRIAVRTCWTAAKIMVRILYQRRCKHYLSRRHQYCLVQRYSL